MRAVVYKGRLFRRGSDRTVTVTNLDGASVCGTWGPSFRCVGDISVADNEIFVGDWHCVHVLRDDGSRLRSWGREGESYGEFQGVKGLAVREGAVYVADAGNHRVQVFTRAGLFLFAFPVACPASVDVTPEFIAVVSNDYSDIRTFDLNGTPLQVTARIWRPHYIVIPFVLVTSAAGYSLILDLDRDVMQTHVTVTKPDETCCFRILTTGDACHLALQAGKTLLIVTWSGAVLTIMTNENFARMLENTNGSRRLSLTHDSCLL